MISFAVYKLVHLIGLFALFLACGMYFRRPAEEEPTRKLAAWLGGGAMFLIILGGFGMLARLEIHGGFPGWIYAKLLIWIVAALMIGGAIRKKIDGSALAHAVLILGALAGFFALWKPF